jgi:hypothetical protein
MDDENVVSIRPRVATHNYDIGRPPAERTIPIEASEPHKAVIEAHPAPVGLEHSYQVHDLYLAYHEDDEKRRLFGWQTDNDQMRELLDGGLSKGLDLLQREHVTVVGIFLETMQTIIEGHPVLQKQLLGPALFHDRSSREVRTEIAIVAKSMARLQSEFDSARERETSALKAAMEAASVPAGDDYEGSPGKGSL